MCTEEVEDKTHFLTQCRLYGTRDHYWATNYSKVSQLRTLSNTDHFIYIMNQEDPELTELIMKMNHAESYSYVKSNDDSKIKS